MPVLLFVIPQRSFFVVVRTAAEESTFPFDLNVIPENAKPAVSGLKARAILAWGNAPGHNHLAC
jgi:hypothetical protein